MENSNQNLQIPLLDFQNIGSLPPNLITDDLIKDLGHQLVQQSKICGLVKIKNHGLSLDFIREINDACGQFFALSDDIKMKYPRLVHPDEQPTFQGYTNGKFDNLNVTANEHDFKEIFSVTHMDHLFPEEVPAIKTSTAKSFAVLEKFVPYILMMLEEGLGISKGALLSKHDPIINGITTLGVLHYPVVPEDSAGIVRFSPHQDFSTFTLQFQSNGDGFQIEHDNKWEDVDVEPDIINMFYGKAFELLTGDFIKAVKHRVIITGNKQNKYVRKSTCLFISTGPDAMLTNLFSPDDGISILSKDFTSMAVKEVYKKAY